MCYNTNYMSYVTPANWIFAPTGEGALFAHVDASIEHFGDSPLPNAVREVIQNSLDAAAPDRGQPVRVVFEQTLIRSETFGGGGR